MHRMQHSVPMMYLSGLVALLLVLTADARAGNSSVCAETEQCMQFDVLCKNEDFEVHHYSEVKWVSTSQTTWDTLVDDLKRLNDYFNGSNDKGMIFEMAFPFTLKLPFNMSAMDVFTLSCLLPEEYQIETPNPLDSMVNIDTTPDMWVYARSFVVGLTGLADSNVTESLSNVLDDADAKYDEEFYYVALYNSSIELTDGYSEVWFTANYEPVSSSSSSSSSEETLDFPGC